MRRKERSLRTLAWFSGSIVLLSGCASGPKAGSNVDFDYNPDDPHVPVEFDEGEGAIEGRVVDEEFLPISGARVSIPELARESASDSQGEFHVGQLPRGAWALVGDADGFEPTAQAVDVRAGHTEKVSLVLRRLPADAPYHRVFETWNGEIRCGIGADAILLEISLDTCDDAQLGGNVSTTVTWPSRMNALQFEAAWTPSNSYGGLLKFRCSDDNTPGPADYWCQVGYATFETWWKGDCEMDYRHSYASPYVRRCQFFDNESNAYWSGGHSMTFRVLTGSNTPLTPSQSATFIALSQRFTVYLTGFFAGAEIPDNYKARPDE